MPIGVARHQSRHALPKAQPASQSWTCESTSDRADALDENEELPLRSRSYDNITVPRKPSSSDSNDSFDEEFVSLSGPFSVEMLGEEVLGASRAVVYVLRVTGSDGDYVIRRRYKSFAMLSAAVAAKILKPLPAMPPKSFFRKRLSPSFMKERSRCLELIAVAAVAADPHADAEELRQFLGLDSQVSGAHENAYAQWCLQRMSTIAEAECENSMLGSHLVSCLEGSKFESGIAGPETWSVISDTPAWQREPARLGCVEEHFLEEGHFDCVDLPE